VVIAVDASILEAGSAAAAATSECARSRSLRGGEFSVFPAEVCLIWICDAVSRGASFWLFGFTFSTFSCFRAWTPREGAIAIEVELGGDGCGSECRGDPKNCCLSAGNEVAVDGTWNLKGLLSNGAGSGTDCSV